MDIWSLRYESIFPQSRPGGFHFFPNLETLAGDDGGGRDILAGDDIISRDDQGKGDLSVELLSVDVAIMFTICTKKIDLHISLWHGPGICDVHFIADSSTTLLFVIQLIRQPPYES